ncbi:transporter [Carboxylicivirga sp. A043]|uniref:aspartate:alanine exchanger family transporter n=1 Tax=Carboxylicivirga litoralis TaxID=2816963 RepID=UPI0021CB81E1|nr:TrkA C-terminal domain-containing protein [Carboxylicivirga sp. A043]MCU4156671.1 transporter [Carboxylicivirga sp. A043]
MELIQTSYFALFVIICLGFIIGNLKVKGVSLDISAIIFVALVFGHFGIVMPSILEKIGLILFIYTIGVQAGPGFFDSFQKNGRNLALLATVVIISASVMAYILYYAFGLDMPIVTGLLTGALTSTPGLAAAIETTNSPLVSIGYGVAYPFGVIGVILFAKFYPKIIKADIKKAEKDYEKSAESGFPEIMHRNLMVENENVIGKTIGHLRVRSMTQAVISRVMHDGCTTTPNINTVLSKGDLVRAVGTKDALEKIAMLIGSETKEEIPLDAGYEVQSILVTNTEAVNKALSVFNLWTNYQATVTRIRRSGIDITPSPSVKLQMGDKVMVACSRENMKQVIRIFGNNDKKLSDTDFFPVAAGIVLGVLFGKMSLSFGGSFSFSLGLTGGVLAVSMILARIGRTGPVIWSMSGAANQLLRQLGLMLFLASVGTKAGATLVDTYNNYGAQLFVVGGILTLFPMMMAVVAAYFMKSLNILTLLGTITGSMTSTPGLAAVDSMTDSNAAAIAYATVYPVAMVLLVICVQILGFI